MERELEALREQRLKHFGNQLPGHTIRDFSLDVEALSADPGRAGDLVRLDAVSSANEIGQRENPISTRAASTVMPILMAPAAMRAGLICPAGLMDATSNVGPGA